MRRNKAFKLETDNRVDVVKSVCRVKVSISFLSFYHDLRSHWSCSLTCLLAAIALLSTVHYDLSI